MNRLYEWISERYKIDKLFYFAREKTVPVHKGSIWYYFGGISLFLFMIQVITGLILLFYYRVGPDASFESIKFIITKVKFGWLIRNVHAWSANLMVFTVMIHLVSVLFERSYRNPRELTWLTGLIMFFLTVTFGFSGYLLPWNELAFSATKVGTDSAKAIPIIGDFLLNLLRGGTDVTGATLSRFFGLHISVLPPLFTLLLGMHLVFVQSQGMSKPIGYDTSGEKRKPMPFFPNFVLRDIIAWFIVLDLLILLSVYFPWELGVKADQFSPAPTGIKPEWYFLFIFQTLKMIPAHVGPFEGEVIGLSIMGVGALILVLIPFLDRAAARGERNRIWDWLCLVGLGYFGIFTILGYMLD